MAAQAQSRKWIWAGFNRQKRLQKWVAIVQSLSHTELSFQLLCKTALSNSKVCPLECPEIASLPDVLAVRVRNR